jgi:NAD(P)-dependent dehydrogenase (short-subunit alcohol dehydrogenase family)
MTRSEPDIRPSVQDVALIVGGGPGISASCVKLFAENGMRVGIAARNPDKPVLERLETAHGVRRYACDASEPAAVESLFQNVVRDLGALTLVVHNIDGRVPGIFRKGITEADPAMALDTLRNSAFSAFLVCQQAARLMRDNKINANGAKERSSSRTPARRSKVSRRAAPLRWRAMPNPASPRVRHES